MNIILRNLPVTYASWAVRITFKIGAKVKNLPVGSTVLVMLKWFCSSGW